MPERNVVPTAQEICVLRAMAEHGTIAAAKALCVSPHTVDSHLDRLRFKTGVRHTTELIAWAAHRGWLPRAPLPQQ